MESVLMPIDSEKLLMHRGRMKFVENLAVYEKESGRTSLDVRRNNIFLMQNLELDPVIFVELIAQSVACHSGYSKFISGANPRHGYLVGVKDLVVTGKAILGDHLDVLAEKGSEFDTLVYVKGTVLRNGNETICSGIIKCWETEMEIPINGLSAKIDPGSRYAILESLFDSMSPSETDKSIVSRITSLSKDKKNATISADIYIDSGFIGFDGHFPKKPILPGVMMIKMGITALSLGFEKKIRLMEIKQSKFMKVIEPGHLIRIELSYSDAGGGVCDFQFQVFISEVLCAKISATAGIIG